MMCCEDTRIMNRRDFTLAIAAGTTAAMIEVPAARSAGVSVKNVVMVHGLYADGSSWSDVIVQLQANGLKVTSVQNPLTTFEDDVAAATRALDMQDGPSVLVAHSYGGMVATQAGVHPKVVGLVYIAARAPDAGENYSALASRFPTPPASKGLVTVGNYLMLSEDAFLNDFANGVDPVKAHELFAVQQLNVATLSPNARTTAAAWRTKPSWYAVSKQDRTIDPDLERFMAKRMNATTIEIDSGHLSLVSHVPEVSSLIMKAVAAS
jgi:pimeloyl-ACP methyl ester carboxylesterase